MPDLIVRVVVAVLFVVLAGLTMLAIAMHDPTEHYNADGLPRDGDAMTPERRARLKQWQRRVP